MSDTVEACPNCDEASHFERVEHVVFGRPATHDKTFKCIGCGHPFDEPVVRENRRGLNASQSRLLDMDPDEVLG